MCRDLLAGLLQRCIVDGVSRLQCIGAPLVDCDSRCIRSDRWKLRVSDSFTAYPGMRRSATPGHVNYADGNVFFLRELAAEEVTHGGEVLCCFRRAQCPGILRIALNDSRGAMPLAKKADLWLRRGADLFVPIQEWSASEALER